MTPQPSCDGEGRVEEPYSTVRRTTQENRRIIGSTKPVGLWGACHQLSDLFTFTLRSPRSAPSKGQGDERLLTSDRRRTRSNPAASHKSSHHTLKIKNQVCYYYSRLYLRQLTRHALSSPPLRLCMFQTHRTLRKLVHWSRRAILCR